MELAIVLALAASFCTAMSSVCQRLGARSLERSAAGAHGAIARDPHQRPLPQQIQAISRELAADRYTVTVPDLAGAVAAGPPYHLRQARMIADSAAGQPVIS